MADKYYTVRGHKYKSMVYQVNMEPDKRKKENNRQIEIKCKFPKPGGLNEKPGVSYLNQAELDALRKESSFTCFEKDGSYAITEIPFKDLPEDKQKEYDVKAYQALKTEQAKAS